MVKGPSLFLISKALLRRLRPALCILFFCSAALPAASALGQQIPKYRGARVTRVVRERGTFALLVDRDEIRKEYPFLAGRPDREIDQWIVDHTSYMKESQVKQEIVNTPIPTGDDSGDLAGAIQPFKGFRASVFLFKNPDGTKYVVDAKGTGTLSPRDVHNGSGVETLIVAAKEHIISKLVEKILKHSGVDLDVVPHLAATGSSFFVKKNGQLYGLAGKLVRAPREREYGENLVNFFVKPEKAMALEMLFRFYGLSAFYKGDQTINVQESANHSLFDFGHYSIPVNFSMGAARARKTDGTYVDVWGPNSTMARQRGAAALAIPIETSGEIIADDKLYTDLTAIFKRHIKDDQVDRNALVADVNQYADHLFEAFSQKLEKTSFVDWLASQATRDVTVPKFLRWSLKELDFKPETLARMEESFEAARMAPDIIEAVQKKARQKSGETPATHC